MEKFQSKDLRLIGVCLVIILASLFILDKYFYQAFPEASIQFKVGREDSQPVAEKFLADLGLTNATGGYRHSVIFDHDDQAKVFLERELGLVEAGKYMGSRVKLWRWSHRWFKPLQKEEFRVSVSPEGSINGFSHLLPEEAPGAMLAADSAQTLAEKFLSERLALDLTQLELINKESQQRPHRTDHTFTWKVSSLNIHEADYRYEVGIWGATAGSFREFLHVPDAWQRDYEKLRARNDSSALVAGMFLVITLLGTLWFFIDRARRHDVRWKTAMWFAIIGAALTFFVQLNSLNLKEFEYNTRWSYSSFVGTTLLGALIAGVIAGGSIFILTAGAEPLYRERYGEKMSLTNHFRWRGLRSKNFVTGTILGIALAFFFCAYQSGFYIIAQKYGAWTPARIPYSDLLNTAFPWIFVLLVGYVPAVTQEFMSRMFSIPFFEKLLKWRWLAVVIPAFIWGFTHANYPNQPFYIRGLELGIAGIIIGYLMLRYNILVALIWHYTYEALYPGLLMFRSGNTYLTVSATIATGIMLAPLAAALFSYWRHGGFEPVEGLLNSDEVSPFINLQRHFPHKWFWPMAVSSFLMCLTWKEYLLYQRGHGSQINLAFYIIHLLVLITTHVYLLAFTYHLWKRIPKGQRTTDPKTAVIGLIIPIFNLYWMFVVWPGYAKAFNNFRERHNLPGRASRTIAFIFTLSWLSVVLTASFASFLLGVALFLYFFMTMVFVSDMGSRQRIRHDYQVVECDGQKLIIDRATNLTWQQAGSPNYLTYADAEKYISNLNNEHFGGYENWRLPTLVEAMSLVEDEAHDNLHIDTKYFDNRQWWIWTTDKSSANVASVVNFQDGDCYNANLYDNAYVRAVR